MVGSKIEIMALQILNSIRTDINEGIYYPESIYSIRNSQLLHLITGLKSRSSVDQIETIRCPEEFVGHIGVIDQNCQQLTKMLTEPKKGFPIVKQKLSESQIVSKTTQQSNVVKDLKVNEEVTKSLPKLQTDGHQNQTE